MQYTIPYCMTNLLILSIKYLGSVSRFIVEQKIG